MRDPRLPADTAEDVCDDHAAVALDERPDDGLEVSAAEAGASCGRCAEEAPAAGLVELGPGESWEGVFNGARVRVQARRPAETLAAARPDAAEGHVAPLDLDAIDGRHQAAERGGWYSRADAEFKSRAHEDIPALVAEIRRLRANEARRLINDYMSPSTAAGLRAPMEFTCAGEFVPVFDGSDALLPCRCCERPFAEHIGAMAACPAREASGR